MTATEPVVIFETVHGSHAYGLAREGSDLDLKGVVVGPAAWYHGFAGGPEQVELGPDHMRWEVRKLFRLAVNANPTVLEALFTDERDHRVVTAAGRRLLDARKAFLSRRVGESFGEYARAQLGRIRRHRRWLLEPPRSEPTRGDFGLPERTVVPRDQLGAAEALLEKGRLGEGDLSEGFLDLLDREKKYRAARREWEQYQRWQRERNPARAALEATWGFDSKHALHLIRLQRMGLEVLQGGELVVRRDRDRDELLAVRDGAWSYDALVAESERMAALIRDAALRSALPEAPDEPFLDALCASIVDEVLRC